MDDLVSQVHMLETSKMKLELEITQMKKDFRREIQTKEDDLEDIRLANNKKVKVLEAQLEQEHEERMGQVRDKHELEAKVQSLQDLLDRSGDEEVLTKLRRDLKRTKALLKDAQMYMEKNQSDGTNKVIVRQLKNQVFLFTQRWMVTHWSWLQLEDAEFARTAALKARGNIELELVETNSMLEDSSRAKTEMEEKLVKVKKY